MNKEILKTAEDLVIACDRVYNRKLQTGSGGNVSARIPGTEWMLVKASGGSMGDCVVDAEKGIIKGFVVCDFDGNLIEGEDLPKGKPTKEATLHGYIYKVQPSAGAVVHVHSPYAIAWSSTKKALPLVTWHSKLKFKAELPTLNVLAAMVREEDVPMVEAMFAAQPDLDAFLLADHGAVGIGKTAVAAEHVVELIEETAQVAILEKLLGTLPL
ncbi:MAG: class II aldolase/adducin family protein [Oscillospiraceae bacterium]|nr:class II aldolase/adducin family protein [Oscillospiraceae bacterium]